MLLEIDIHTDGGCHGNPGPGGWAFVLRTGADVISRSGFEAVTTNNRMELTAVIESLRTARTVAADRQCLVRVHTDSQYVKGGITEWMKKWRLNGWRTSGKQPVKNQDLWKLLHEVSDLLNVSWFWVKGHSGNPDNELCDALVQQAIQSSGRSDERG
jgi:ribonuclease HI